MKLRFSILFLDVAQWSKTCYVCGISAPSHCTKCKVNYCSRVHQVHDWKNGHKETCGTETSSSHNLLFPEYEIVMEDDDSIAEKDDVDSEHKEIEEYNAMIQNDEVGTFQHDDVNDDLLQMASSETDETFVEFREKINNYPDQILRCFLFKKRTLILLSIKLIYKAKLIFI